MAHVDETASRSSVVLVAWASDVRYGTGRAPRMAYAPWFTSQGVELGATAQNHWYRRCVQPGCRRWAGPYPDAGTAKDEGLDHRSMRHRNLP